MAAVVADPAEDVAAAIVERPPPPPPLSVEYDAVTGIPAEFNEYLPSNCDEYKRWKAVQAGGDAAAEAVASLSIAGDGAAATSSTPEGGEAAATTTAAEAAPSTTEAAAADAATAPPKKKKASKSDPTLVLELSSRGKKKSVTTISGLDLFGVKLPEASKMLGKKFACGASVTKTAEAGREQVEVQGDVVARAAELLVEQYGKDGKGVAGFPLLTKGAVYSVVSKKKERVFPDA